VVPIGKGLYTAKGHPDLISVDRQAKDSNAIAFQLHIPTCEAAMHVTDKGQVTIPKHIRDASAWKAARS
jgi:hypothetical protein